MPTTLVPPVLIVPELVIVLEPPKAEMPSLHHMLLLSLPVVLIVPELVIVLEPSEI